MIDKNILKQLKQMAIINDNFLTKKSVFIFVKVKNQGYIQKIMR